MVHRNSPRKRALQIEKPPGTIRTELQTICFATKSSPRHNRVDGHRNNPTNVLRRYSQSVLQAMICDEIVSWVSTCRGTLKESSIPCSAGRKTPRYSRNRATNYGLRQNRLLGISVSRYTETLLQNVLSRSKKPQVQSKPSSKLWFETKTSPGHKRVEVY